MNTPSLPCRSWLYQLFSDFSVTILFFFLCKLTPNTGNCYFCIFLIFLTEFSSVLFFEKPIHFFPFGKQSGKSVRVTLYTLLQLSLGTRVPNTKRTLFTSCSHTRHVPVCNSKAICWGSLSPVPSPFQNCLLFWWDEFPPWTLGWFCSPLSETSDHPRKIRRHALQSPQKQVWRLALQHMWPVQFPEEAEVLQVWSSQSW